IMLWLPAAAGLLGLFMPGRTARFMALLGALGALGYAIAFVIDYDSAAGGLQHVTDRMWIRSLGVHYKLGVDGRNIFLILLTGILFTATTLWSMGKEWPREKQFYLQLGLGHSAVLGALTAQDLALFIAFFDLMLVPFFFLTGIWGGKDRVSAVIKLFI